MLPLQITLEGFMCYREAQTFDFRGASLWMLCGRNGAGKSTVFDAMRWVLFGVHRGGATGNEALITHEMPSMRVVFDFESQGAIYRLTRTLTRKGRASWQIERQDGEAFVAVPSTDMKVGYDDWIAHNLGLSDHTFSAAMYLGQGRADSLLNANDRDRHQILAEVVDLGAYERLHAMADAERKAARDELQRARGAYESAPLVAPEAVEAQKQLVAHTQQQLTSFEEEQRNLERLEPLAAQWQKWDAEHRDLAAQHETVREILAGAEELERGAQHLDWLMRVLPSVKVWLETTARRDELVARRDVIEGELVTWDVSYEAAQAHVKTIAAQYGDLQRRGNEQRTALAAILQQLHELAGLEAHGLRWIAIETQERELSQKLESFPVDLSGKAWQLERDLRRAERSERALPQLRRLGEARETWKQAGQSSAQEKIRLTEHEVQAETLAARYAECEAQRQRLSESLQAVHERDIVANIRLQAAMKAQERFDQVADEAKCHFCGQPLSEEHREAEAQRLENERLAAHDELEAGRQEREAAHLQELEIAEALNAVQSEREELERVRQDTLQRINEANHAAEKAMLLAGAAIEALGEDYRVRLAAGVERVLLGSFPTEEDFTALEQETAHVAELKVQIEALEATKAEQESVKAQLASVQHEKRQLSADLPEEQRTQVEAQVQRLNSSSQARQRALDSVEKQLIEFEAARTQATSHLQTLQHQKAQLEAQLAGIGGELTAIGRDLERQLHVEDAQIQAQLERDVVALETDFQKWQQEQTQLEAADVRGRMHAVIQARQRIGDLETQLAFLARQIEQLPEPARQPVEQLQGTLVSLRQQREQCADELARATKEAHRLEAEFATKARLETEMLKHETTHRRWATLAELLGPDKLQRFLLRDAEVGIIEEANTILDRISDGTLHLDLRGADTQVAGRARNDGALDFVVYQADGSEEAQAVFPTFLSGSQRFRVAVALALGIGRYAARRQNSARLESVIIDEGFGSLDRVGRDEMITELRALGDELKRVVLVSHQEDFAEAFPNRYVIEHDGRGARARLEGA